MAQTNLYDQLNSLVNSYFKLDHFLDDLIRYHVHIEPKKLKASDLKALSSWLEIAVSLIIDDQKSINRLMHKVRELAEAKKWQI